MSSTPRPVENAFSSGVGRTEYPNSNDRYSSQTVKSYRLETEGIGILPLHSINSDGFSGRCMHCHFFSFEVANSSLFALAFQSGFKHLGAGAGNDRLYSS